MIDFQFSQRNTIKATTLRQLIVEQQKTHKVVVITLNPKEELISAAHEIFLRSLSRAPVHSFKAIAIETGSLCDHVRYTRTQEILPRSYFGETVTPCEMRARLGSNEMGCAGVRILPRGELFFLRPGERVYDQHAQGLLYAEPRP